jgi:hypothetical protein
MIDQYARKPDTESRARRGFFPTLKNDYDRLCDELGGPADIGFSIPHPKVTLAGYCREHPCVRVLPVLTRFQPDKSRARKHWPWVAFAIAQYAFEQKERKSYTDEPTPKELRELLTQFVQSAQKLRSAFFDLDVLSNRLDDRNAPLRRGHIRWLDLFVSQAAAGFLSEDVNESGEHLLMVDAEKRVFIKRLGDIEAAAKAAKSRFDPKLVERERGQSIPGLPNFVRLAGAIWLGLTGRKPSANKVTKRSIDNSDPDFVVFIQELAKLVEADHPTIDQVAFAMRSLRTWNYEPIFPKSQV